MVLLGANAKIFTEARECMVDPATYALTKNYDLRASTVVPFPLVCSYETIARILKRQRSTSVLMTFALQLSRASTQHLLSARTYCLSALPCARPLQIVRSDPQDNFGCEVNP